MRYFIVSSTIYLSLNIYLYFFGVIDWLQKNLMGVCVDSSASVSCQISVSVDLLEKLICLSVVSKKYNYTFRDSVSEVSSNSLPLEIHFRLKTIVDAYLICDGWIAKGFRVEYPSIIAPVVIVSDGFVADSSDESVVRCNGVRMD